MYIVMYNSNYGVQSFYRSEGYTATMTATMSRQVQACMSIENELEQQQGARHCSTLLVLIVL